ncbi:hypothetical protein DUI87_00464 [Hirundo rustica rustica]|uniref:Ig-like domain-containing protein n=1 Tax=Hirundo rustica rustica TaxID=333673 RepID=A0A3M0LAA9_HIRRU|nr:hypothetical protein DUI87_00464 [Hirundo rustica rustica]
MSPTSPMSPNVPDVPPLTPSPLPTASLFISTLTPKLQGLLGTPQTLHCSLAPAPGAFTLEWLHHRHGATRRLLAFDSATSRLAEAAPGVLLLLGGRAGTPVSGSAAGTPPPGGALEVSLQLSALSVSDDGSFVCSVTTPHGQVQQVLQMNVIGATGPSVEDMAGMALVAFVIGGSACACGPRAGGDTGWALSEPRAFLWLPWRVRDLGRGSGTPAQSSERHGFDLSPWEKLPALREGLQATRM